jgi:hypothetical protein
MPSGQLGPDRGDLPAFVAEPTDQGLGIWPVVGVGRISPELAEVIGNDCCWVTQGDAGTLNLRLVAHRHHTSCRPALAGSGSRANQARCGRAGYYAPAAEQAGTFSCSRASRPQKLRSPTFQVPLTKTAWPCWLLSAGWPPKVSE